MSRHAFRSVDLPSLHPNRVPAHRAPKHRSNRLEDSCSLVCNAGYEDGGDCSTYLGRHALGGLLGAFAREYRASMDWAIEGLRQTYGIGDPA